jgi:hypothetical protein
MFQQNIDVPFEKPRADDKTVTRAAGDLRRRPGMARPQRGPRGLQPGGYNPEGSSPEYMDSPSYNQPGIPLQPGAAEEKITYLKQTAFVIQFIWQYKPKAERLPTPPYAASETAADPSNSFDPTAVASPTEEGAAPGTTEPATTEPAPAAEVPASGTEPAAPAPAQP